MASPKTADHSLNPGVASEGDTLTPGERRRQVALLAECMAGRAPIVLGASDPDPAASARHIDQAREVGAAAAMVMAPLHLGNDIDAQTNYFRAVSRDAGVPLMLQNQPRPIGAGLTPEEVGAIARAVAYSDEVARPFRYHVARDPGMMSPALSSAAGSDFSDTPSLLGQSLSAGLRGVRRMLSPESSMRWALWTRRSRMASERSDYR